MQKKNIPSVLVWGIGKNQNVTFRQLQATGFSGQKPASSCLWSNLKVVIIAMNITI